MQGACHLGHSRPQNTKQVLFSASRRGYLARALYDSSFQLLTLRPVYTVYIERHFCR